MGYYYIYVVENRITAVISSRATKKDVKLYVYDGGWKSVDIEDGMFCVCDSDMINLNILIDNQRERIVFLFEDDRDTIVILNKLLSCFFEENGIKMIISNCPNFEINYADGVLKRVMRSGDFLLDINDVYAFFENIKHFSVMRCAICAKGIDKVKKRVHSVVVAMLNYEIAEYYSAFKTACFEVMRDFDKASDVDEFKQVWAKYHEYNADTLDKYRVDNAIDIYDMLLERANAEVKKEYNIMDIRTYEERKNAIIESYPEFEDFCVAAIVNELDKYLMEYENLNLIAYERM